MASGLDEKMDEMAQSAGLAGKAGERAASERGEWSVLASDVILKLEDVG